jgi:hypothetical protein
MTANVGTKFARNQRLIIAIHMRFGIFTPVSASTEPVENANTYRGAATTIE